MDKPNSAVCSECSVVHNRIRCMTCMHKTPEYVSHILLTSSINMIGEHNNFKKKEKIIMNRNKIFEIIFDKNPDFVICECDEEFFEEDLDQKDMEAIKERMKNFIKEN